MEVKGCCVVCTGTAHTGRRVVKRWSFHNALPHEDDVSALDGRQEPWRRVFFHLSMDGWIPRLSGRLSATAASDHDATLRAMRIAIGSTRASKVRAVQEAWNIFASKIAGEHDEKVEFASFDVPRIDPAMPTAVEDLMSGAQTQADRLMLQLKREKAEADFYVGLESGFNVVDPRGARRLVFLESWAFVSDGHVGYFGHGGGILVPSAIATQVMDRGIELGIVMERFAQQKDIGGHEEVWGVLTREILSRQHSFVIALIAAFAPFYNPEAYQS